MRPVATQLTAFACPKGSRFVSLFLLFLRYVVWVHCSTRAGSSPCATVSYDLLRPSPAPMIGSLPRPLLARFGLHGQPATQPAGPRKVHVSWPPFFFGLCCCYKLWPVARTLPGSGCSRETGFFSFYDLLRPNPAPCLVLPRFPAQKGSRFVPRFWPLAALLPHPRAGVRLVAPTRHGLFFCPTIY